MKTTRIEQNKAQEIKPSELKREIDHISKRIDRILKKLEDADNTGENLDPSDA